MFCGLLLSQCPHYSPLANMTPRRPEQWVGILITCTLHVPYHLEFTMIILPWLQQWGQRGLFPLRWERSRSQAVSRCEYTSSGSELLKAFFCGCVCIIASVEGACLSVLWLWGADSSPRVPPPPPSARLDASPHTSIQTHTQHILPQGRLSSKPPANGSHCSFQAGFYANRHFLHEEREEYWKY